MHHSRGWIDTEEEDQADSNRQTASLAGLAAALALVVVALFLVEQLRAEAVLEDCLLSGRSNCVVIAPNAR
ncbi:MAG TPA: hypothetical protein VME92_06645 [Acetobacteraceae bacterium]|nr:hypothetical protein [Acetobacteraceae bacterium]